MENDKEAPLTASAPAARAIEIQEEDDRRFSQAMQLVCDEAARIYKKFGPHYASEHELASVLREEYEEFWDEVKRDNVPLMVKELVQVAAVALRGIAQYQGLTVRTGGFNSPTIPELKEWLKLLSWDEFTALATEANIHFAVIDVFRDSRGTTNNQFAPADIAKLIIAGRKLYPAIFNK